MIELGHQFGLYVIKEKVSSSDGYVCCKAEDPFFNREVALKVYSTELFSNDENLAKVETLLENLAVLDHPSIAPIYDSGLEGDYYYYTTTCDYSSDSLASQLSEPLATEQVLTIATELAQALEYAQNHELKAGEINAENIFYDVDGRAVIGDFGITRGLNQILDLADQEERRDNSEAQGDASETLRSFGELLLQLSLGSKVDLTKPIDDLLQEVEDLQFRKLLGRFLLPGEWQFSSYSELLDELAQFDLLAPLLNNQPEAQSFEAYSDAVANEAELSAEESSDLDIAEIRQLVAEKNSLQQGFDKAVYDRNIAENKFAERVREIAAAQEAVAKAQEEANVAWELVAGQKYERWRPVTWAVGGFFVGFLLSGSYGYYYSEQTRNELLTKLQANEELIKTASWRAAEPPQLAPAVVEHEPAVVEHEPAVVEHKPAVVEHKPAVVEHKPAVVEHKPAVVVKEVTQQWWPAGNEFSVTAAIPVEQIKAALGLKSKRANEGISEVLRNEVIALVGDWANSWSNQDQDGYFSFYSQEYKPELGRSLKQWRDQRKQRLSRPEFIELDLDDISVRKIDENRIQVKMKQSYRSDYYQDRIFKSINLIKENGRWRILMERSLGMVDDIVGG